MSFGTNIDFNTLTMFNSTQDWRLPSPSSTPTSPSIQDHLLLTPKTAPSHSHFLDAFTTPDVNAASTPHLTPLFTFDSPVFSHSKNRLRSPEDPSFHVNHFSQDLTLLPVEPSRRLTSSPNPSSTPVKQREVHHRSKITSKLPSNSEMDPSQIQTPPPTRDSSSRKKHGQPQSVYRNITPATTGHRSTQVSTPVNQNAFNSTPVQFPSLRSSTSGTPIFDAGPLTTPIYSQRLFWEDDSVQQDMGMNVNLSVDPFGPTPGRNNTPFGWPLVDSGNQMQFNDLSQHNTTNASDTSLPFTSTSGDGLTTSSFTTGSFAATSGVDPSMLFSFGGPFDMSGSNKDLTDNQPVVDHLGRRPYEQQTREFEQERQQRELAKQRKQQQHSRTNTTSSSGSSGQPSRPLIQRSRTESTIWRDSNTAFAQSRTPTSSSQLEHIPRRSSPLKRLSSQGGLSAIAETNRSRPRTRLVIDESGRARTETDPYVQARQEKTPQPKYRTQYPGHWDTDDSSEEDEDRPVSSRTNSFAFPASSTRPSSKHARDSLGKSGSAKKARPTSFISLTKAFEKPGPDEISDSLRRYSMSSFNDSLGLSSVSATEPGDAQHALKAIRQGREGRIRTQQRAAQNTLNAHNKRWSQAAAVDIMKLSYADPFTSSPTNRTADQSLDFATPSTDRSSASADSTRCVCMSLEGEGLMIQCESCTKWLHATCVGVHPQNVPSVYLCTFCTGSTPAARGGRAREPMMRAPVNAYANTSPLKHKSTYRR
ncbi:hypothetical protein EJ05DRAFT_52162 [Pseudovirgaria hyperparasitica]|uniref:PHD-type domain-containing protein n=1 Tax=Pseudovirgaria hyperparasitica TaxID=470096 RepID=A0A6A6W342_9PEZI|nr:uncharacterized protein EJ05DRAFT_52162 [Pseudovirgaria hyperparasitica]KAF2757023.1 hypothetical protein EJ05DRAFT_52162 [Pseudovirgaria hyperparasitica]